MEDLRVIGTRFKAIRKKKGYSQRRLAEELHIGVSTVQRLEKGKYGFDKRMAAALVLFGESLERFLHDIAPELGDYELFKPRAGMIAEPGASGRQLLVRQQVPAGQWLELEVYIAPRS